ncbi:hypothetical protein RIF29_09472 [Crotalaria pallida]|uniref:Uncharacterized protein n=1 Tax=Crotalaria pallida TaxID=3830 RepID=A0AAN9ILM8_CROPI
MEQLMDLPWSLDEELWDDGCSKNDDGSSKDDDGEGILGKPLAYEILEAWKEMRKEDTIWSFYFVFWIELDRNLSEVCGLLLNPYWLVVLRRELVEDGSEKLLKEFILDQPQAYEIKMRDQVFRRPGDPPLEEVVRGLLVKKAKKIMLIQRKFMEI